MLKNNLTIYRLHLHFANLYTYISHTMDFAGSQHFTQIELSEDESVMDLFSDNGAYVIIFNDTIPTHCTYIAVVHNGMIQNIGGSGSCFNPVVRQYNGELYMSKPRVLNYMELARKVVLYKYHLLRNMKLIDYRFRMQDSVLYESGMYGLLSGLLDLIGMGKVQADDVVFDTTPQRRLLPVAGCDYDVDLCVGE